MSRKHRGILVLIIFWSVVFGVSGVWLWRTDRQARVNRQLIESITINDFKSAVARLEQGADANTRDEPDAPVWMRLWSLLRHKQDSPGKAPTALLVLLGEREEFIAYSPVYREESLELVSTLLTHGANVNVIDQKG